MKDQQGLIEFENFLLTEYSQENIRFWKEVEDMKYGPRSKVEATMEKIYRFGFITVESWYVEVCGA